jgi:hypothetical protein
MCFDNSNANVGCYVDCWCFDKLRCWLLVDNSNVIVGCYVGFWVHLNVNTIFQKMWTIISKLKDNCHHFLWMLWMLRRLLVHVGFYGCYESKF